MLSASQECTGNISAVVITSDSDVGLPEMFSVPQLPNICPDINSSVLDVLRPVNSATSQGNVKQEEICSPNGLITS